MANVIDKGPKISPFGRVQALVLKDHYILGFISYWSIIVVENKNVLFYLRFNLLNKGRDYYVNSGK